MNSKQIRFIGRHIKKNNLNYFSYSGCGFEFLVKPTSKSFSIKLCLISELKECDFQFIKVFVNGDLLTTEKLISGINEVILNIVNKNEVLIKIIKINETYYSSLYLKNIVLSNCEFVNMSKSRKPIIGFFGDSITTGFGNIDFYGEEFKMEGQDFTKTYAFLVCISLNMNYSVVARGGISAALPIYNDKLLGDIYDTVNMFEKCEPDKNLDYAVINLGANDNSAYLQLKDIESKSKALTVFKEKYFELIERIIKDNPNVKIVLMYHMLPLERGVIDAIKSAYQKASISFKNKIKLLECIENSNGACGHPYLTAHEHASKLLIETIKSL